MLNMRQAREPVPPDEPFTTSVRMPGALYNSLMAIAQSEDRTVNSQIVRALREWLDTERGEHPKP